MEIAETHPGNLTEKLVRDNGVLEDSMELDDDGAGRRSSGTDALKLNDIDSGQAREHPTAGDRYKKKKRQKSTKPEERQAFSVFCHYKTRFLSSK